MVFKRVLHLSLKDIPSVVKDIFRFVKPLKIAVDKVFDIRLSIEEALVNAVKHGNKSDNNKRVYLYLRAGTEVFTVEIRDDGKGFNYKKTPLPTTKGNLKKPSGRGIFLIRELMDEVEFFDGGSRIRMVKYLK